MIRKLIDFTKRMLIKYRELIVYVFFGAVTTAVNFAVYILVRLLLTKVVGLSVDIAAEKAIIGNTAQVVAWIAAVLVAFYTNKRFVFEEKDKNTNKTIIQFAKFTSMRLGSFFFEMVAFNVMHVIMGINDLLSKVVIAVFVVIANYFISKIFIFTKKNKS